MPIDGQGGDAPTTYEDLADFLVDNPAADAHEEDSQPSDEPDKESDNPDEPEGDEPDDQSAEDEPEKGKSKDAEEQDTGKTFKVTVKGDDGADVAKEVTLKELTDGYMMRAQFTRETQALANREREAVQMVTKHVEENRNYYLQQAQVAREAVRQLAALRDPQQMAALAQENPALWAQEVQRERLVSNALQQIDGAVQQEAQRGAQQQYQQLQQDRARARTELMEKDGLDDAAVGKIFQTVQKAYGFPEERFAQVREAGLVRMMRDAASYRELLNKRDAVKQKVADAPRIPAPRQQAPKREQVNKALNQRFRSGKASVRDLGAWMASNKL